jgi:hypothetical protein
MNTIKTATPQGCVWIAGYALPSTSSAPTMSSALASMSP